MTFMMNKRYNTNYEDRIEFVIALMTKNYVKARDIGTQLLKYNSNDADIISVLDILKHRDQSEKECQKPNCVSTSSDSLESDSEHEMSDEVSDSENSDFVDDNFTDICIDAELASNNASHNNTQFKKQDKSPNINRDQINNFDFQEKMYRVIPIRINK